MVDAEDVSKVYYYYSRSSKQLPPHYIRFSFHMPVLYIICSKK